MDKAARILVVTGDAESRQILHDALGGYGIELRFASPVLAEVEVAVDAPVSLVLLEFAGHRPGAVDFVRELRTSEKCGHLPMLLLTKGDPDETMVKALEAGASGFLLSPLNPNELLVRMRCLLSLPNLADPITHRERELRSMLELTRDLGSSLDFREILYRIVRRIAEVVQVDRVSIVLSADEPDVGYVVATSDDAGMSDLRLDLNKYPEILHVLNTMQPLTIDDVQTHPVLDCVRSSVQDAGLTALTLIPFVWQEKAAGALFIRAATHKGALTPRELSLCQQLVDAASIPLRNAHVVQTLRAESRNIAHARTQAEQRIRSLRRYADVFASSAYGILVVDAQGRVLLANPGVQNILGYREDELLGRAAWNVIDEADRHRQDEFAAEIGAGRMPDNCDLRVVRKSGEVRTVECFFSLLRGREEATVVSFRDVTEGRRTSEELVKTKTFLESLVETSVDAIVATDRKGTIILYNRAAERIYGWPAEQVVHKRSVKELYPGDGAREVGRMLRSEKFGGPGRVGPIRVQAINAKGQKFPISLTAAFIHEDGEHTATFGIFHDLRERVRVEQELAHVQEKLAITEKQALIAELAGATAHELNQPLTSVLGYAQLLARKLDRDQEVAHAANVIGHEAERMAEIVRKIGKLTRYETRSYVGEQKILDLDRASATDPSGLKEKGK